MIIYIIAAALIVALDQITKYLVSVNLPIGGGFELIPHIMDIRYVQNTGAAFSMFSSSTVPLSVLSLAFCAAVIVFWVWKKPQHPLLRTSLMLLFAGALGNGIDRIFRHYVVDFFSTTFIRFPVFNVADIAVTVGAAMLVIYEIVSESGKKNSGGK